MKWRKFILLINLLVIALVVSTMIGIRGARAITDAWEIVTSPNEGSSGSNYLNAVASHSSGVAVAVGSRYDSGSYKTTIQKWNGLSWSVKTSPVVSSNAELNGVTRIASIAGEFWAVGYQNGSSRTLSESGLWYDIGGGQTLIEHSTSGGSTWTALSNTPSPGSSTNVLNAVSARTGSDVWAVGYYQNTDGLYQTLILHYDGTNWSQSPSPNVPGVDNYLRGVSARASNDVWAVGTYTYGGTDYRTLTLHWNGSQWDIIPSYNPGFYNYFVGVTALGQYDVWAVGSYRDYGQPRRTLIEHYILLGWQWVDSPNVGTGSNDLLAISPISSSAIWSVGRYDNNSHYQTLTQFYNPNGTGWNVITSPNQNSDHNVLQGVSVTPGTQICTGGDIWAVGWYNNTTDGRGETLIERYTISACRHP